MFENLFRDAALKMRFEKKIFVCDRPSSFWSTLTQTTTELYKYGAVSINSFLEK
jgi:hypothetical protein